MIPGVLMRILGLISEAIDGNFTSSKRDIFYQDPVYFGSQKLVDRYVDDIAFTFGVDRAALHVVWYFSIRIELFRILMLSIDCCSKRRNRWAF